MVQSTRENMTIGLRPDKLATLTVAEFQLKIKQLNTRKPEGFVWTGSSYQHSKRINQHLVRNAWWQVCVMVKRNILALNCKRSQQHEYCRCLRSWPVDQVANALELGYGFQPWNFATNGFCRFNVIKQLTSKVSTVA